MTNASSALAAALARLQRGDLDVARDICRGCVASEPANPSAWHLLGLIEHRRGFTNDALAALARGEQLGANAPAQRANHAGVLNAAGLHVEALALSKAALASHPDFPPALINAGLSAAAMGEHEAALTWLMRGLDARPDAQMVRRRAIECAAALRRADEFLALIAHPSILSDADGALRMLNAWPTDGEGVRRVVLDQLAAAHPDHPEVRYSHAVALHMEGLGGEALDDAQCVLAHAPGHADAAMMLSVSLFEHGRIAEGLDTLRDLLARHPDNDAAWASYLVGLHYDPALDQSDLLAEHQRWAACRIGDAEPVPVHALINQPEPDRRLRIGWLSPRLARGAVMQFFAGVIPAFDRSFAEHAVYHDQRGGDAATASLRSQVDEWRDVDGLDDDALVECMRSDRLDVLIDLAGHAPHNRMRALARRVAPVQATWMDYVDTTCVPAMDLILFDKAMAPAESERWISERIIRLSPCRMAFSPPADAPGPSWAGKLDTPFTLGCFNRMPKRNAAVFDRYAAVMSALPGCRLVLLDAALEGRQVRTHVESWLVERGIDLARVDLLGRQTHLDLLHAYRRIDAVIDPFPYAGCTTACDALWMGVPVLTTPGATFASRQSASFLTAIGCERWLCADESSLIAGLGDLARDSSRRTVLRADLRKRMDERVCDARPVAAHLQSVLRAVWLERCRDMH